MSFINSNKTIVEAEENNEPPRGLAGLVDSFRGLSRTVWVLALVALVNRAGSMVLPFMSLYMTNALHASPEQVGRVLTVYGVGGLLGVSVGGWFIDRLRPRAVIIGSLSASAVCFLVLRHVTELASLTIAMLVVGAVVEMFRPANGAAMVAALPPNKRARGFALQTLAFNLGISIGATLGGWLASGTYAALFYVDALTCVAAAGVALALLPANLTADIARQDDEPPLAAGTYVRFGAFMLGFMLITVLFIQFFVTTMLYHDAYNHFSSRAIGALLTINTLLVCVTQMPVTTRVANMPPLKVIGAGTLFLGGGFALLPFSQSYAVAVIAVVIWTVGEVVVSPALNVHTAAMAPPGQVGRFMSVNAAVNTVGRMLAPLIGTVIYQRAGPTTLWFGCAALSAVLATGYYVGSRRAMA